MMKKQIIAGTDFVTEALDNFDIAQGRIKKGNVHGFLQDGWAVVNTAVCNERIEYLLEKEVPAEEMSACCRVIEEYAQNHNVYNLNFCPVCGAKLDANSIGRHHAYFSGNKIMYELHPVTLPIIEDE